MLNGCHLKSKYGAIVLTTIDMDANNRMVSLALTVYQIKNSKRKT